MTAEEFATAADLALSPAIERLVKIPFDTVPPGNVESLVVQYIDMMKDVAITAIHSIIAEEGGRQH